MSIFLDARDKGSVLIPSQDGEFIGSEDAGEFQPGGAASVAVITQEHTIYVATPGKNACGEACNCEASLPKGGRKFRWDITTKRHTLGTFRCKSLIINGGERGIRTPDTILSRIPV